MPEQKSRAGTNVPSTSLLEAVRKGMKDMTDEQRGWPVVAILAGPSECIEIIVQKAARDSGCPMNWGFVGGRACVHSQGDRAICRKHLFCSIPQSDLNQSDMVAASNNSLTGREPAAGEAYRAGVGSEGVSP